MDQDGIRAPFYYWIHKTHTKPEAVALALRLNIELPCGVIESLKAGLLYPVRRLVVTGEDNPTNFALLLGPDWPDVIPRFYKRARMDVLSCPMPGSFPHIIFEHLDEGCPMWRPRPPSEQEEEQLKNRASREKDWVL